VRVRVSKVSKSYGAVQALKDVDFELRAGEVMALLGENGAGKSTLVKLLSGLVQPDTGTVEVNGTAVELTSSVSQRLGIAVVQQEYSSVPVLSVAENLALGDARASWWWGRRTLEAGVREVLDQVGLSHVQPGTPVAELSVAETQLLELARMLRRDAQILILDEPTAALSDQEIERVLGVLKDLVSDGRSIIYVTHRLDEVFRLADRVTIFKDGRSQPPREIATLDYHSVVTAMLGREMSTMFPDRHPLDGRPARITLTDLEVQGLRAPVSLTIRQGEILGLTGQLGSGASTLVRGIAGIVPVLGGQLAVDGTPTVVRNRADGIRKGIAYCSDNRKADGIFAGVSVLKNLSSAWLPKVSNGGWLNKAQERSEARTIATEFAFDAARIRANVGTLSGGNQQKIVLGKWVGANPAVLLVEEPTRGVDVGARAEIYAKLRQLSDSGTAIIVASSDSAEILGFCDTIASFYRGRMTGIRPYDEWQETSLVRATMHDMEAAGS
jgi:ribose transport system ATP-binding protein